MKNPVQITLRGIRHSDALERYIGEEANKLDRYCGSIVSCHMIAEALRPPARRRFGVQLNLTLPGTELVVNREHDEDIFMAVHSAFEAACSQLKDYQSRLAHAEHRPRNGGVDSGS